MAKLSVSSIVKRTYLKEDGFATAFLLFFAALYFLPVLLKGNTQVLSLMGADTWSQFFYWRSFGYTALARGEIPLWNPYIFSGTPYIAGIQSAIFYPLNLLYLFFETPCAINLSVALHCFLASLFTYLFGRYIGIGVAGSTIAGMVFAYGAPYFLHIYAGHLSILSTVIWMPLVLIGLDLFLTTSRLRYAWLTGVPLAVQVLAGHPQYLFYSTMAVFLYFLFALALQRRWREVPYFFGGFCLAVLTAVLLSAVQLFPTVELALYSARQDLTYEWVSLFSFPPENLITLVLPDFFGNGMDVPYWGKNYLWEMSLYLGVVPMILVILGILLHRTHAVLAFLLLALVSLALALGKYTPLLTLLYHYVPGFGWFRGLSKFIFVFAFASATIAGFGLHKLEGLVERRDRMIRKVAAILFAASLLFFGLAFLTGWMGVGFWRSLLEGYIRGEDRWVSPALTNDFFGRAEEAVVRGFLKTAVVSILAGTVLWACSRTEKFSPRHAGIALVALAALDLWNFGSRYLVVFDPGLAYLDRELRAALKSDPQPFRIAMGLSSLRNAGIVDGIENVGGYDTLVLKRYSEFVNFSQGLPLDRPNLAMSIRRTSPLLDLLNVKYYVVDPAINGDHPLFDLAFQNASYKMYRSKSVLPRSFVVHDVWLLSERNAILGALASPTFNPGAQAIVEEAIEGLPGNAALQSLLPRIVDYSPNRVRLEATLERPGLLVLADVHYPGWRAFVDGQEAKVYRANYVMRAVLLPGGNHLVEFRYDPDSFKIGAATSLISLASLAGMFARLYVQGSEFNI